MVQVFLTLVLAVNGVSDKAPTYEEALQLAQKNNKPVMIVIGAKWCAACQVMKHETFEPMKAAGQLEEVVVTYLDKDQRPELAHQLMKGETLPQIVMFTKENDQWRRLSVTGLQNKARIQELLGRVAKAEPEKLQVLR